jgi:hypothetical protein
VTEYTDEDVNTNTHPTTTSAFIIIISQRCIDVERVARRERVGQRERERGGDRIGH